MAQPNQPSQQQTIPAASKSTEPAKVGATGAFSAHAAMFERVLMACIPEARRASILERDGHNAKSIELDDFTGIGRGLIGIVITDRKGHRRLVPWARIDVVDLD